MFNRDMTPLPRIEKFVAYLRPRLEGVLSYDEDSDCFKYERSHFTAFIPSAKAGRFLDGRAIIKSDLLIWIIVTDAKGEINFGNTDLNRDIAKKLVVVFDEQ